jgi:hypothetical protein
MTNGIPRSSNTCAIPTASLPRHSGSITARETFVACARLEAWSVVEDLRTVAPSALSSLVSLSAATPSSSAIRMRFPPRGNICVCPSEHVMPHNERHLSAVPKGYRTSLFQKYPRTKQVIAVMPKTRALFSRIDLLTASVSASVAYLAGPDR